MREPRPFFLLLSFTRIFCYLVSARFTLFFPFVGVCAGFLCDSTFVSCWAGLRVSALVSPLFFYIWPLCYTWLVLRQQRHVQAHTSRFNGFRDKADPLTQTQKYTKPSKKPIKRIHTEYWTKVSRAPSCSIWPLSPLLLSTTELIFNHTFKNPSH